MKTSHAIIHLGIAAADARTLPILVELDNPSKPRISLPVAIYARYLQREGHLSYESIKKAVAVLGKLRDFYVLVAKLENETTRSLIEDFLYAYDHGTVLGWVPASNHRYLAARNAVYDFLRWMDAAQVSTAWPDDEFVTFATYQEAYKYSRHIEHSFLFHTRRRVKKKAAGRKRLIIGLHHYKAFPPEWVVPLIQETKNVRDKLFFAMLAFGGRRKSELIHLFVPDLRARQGELHVTLAHPSESPFHWKTRSGTTTSGSRAEYLKSMFDLLPRTELGELPMAAGWKGMKFDDQVAMASECYWNQTVGSYLLQLHEMYLTVHRSDNRKHPYYFTSGSGSPLTLKAIDKQFELAKRRIEKLYGVDLAEYGLHSLRHYYGFYCADVLRLEILEIQRVMGHLSPLSTAIYAHIKPTTLRTLMADSDSKAKLEGRISCSNEERIALERQFSSIGLKPLPDDWRTSSIAYGIIDTKHFRAQKRTA